MSRVNEAAGSSTFSVSPNRTPSEWNFRERSVAGRSGTGVVSGRQDDPYAVDLALLKIALCAEECVRVGLGA